MYKGILIDIDNTLYDYASTHKAAMDAATNLAAVLFDKEVFLEKFNLAKNQIHDALEGTASSHNRILYFQRTLELLNCKDIMLAKRLYDTYWNTFLENVTLFNGVIDFLKQTGNKKVAVLTDLTADIQYQKITKFKIAPYLDYIITSEEVGVEKPDRKMFLEGLRKLDLSEKEVCMIGDSYDRDIEGALNVGIKPFWKTNEKCLDDRITTFSDFFELAEKLCVN